MIEKITVNKQSSIRIDAGKIIYFDPYMIKDEPMDGDVIFITHSHPDHFSPNDFRRVAKPSAIFVAPKSMEDTMLASGVKKENLITLTPGDVTSVLGIPVKTVPSYNMRKPMHPKKNGWLGYVINVEETIIYVCGDTDAIPEGKKVNCDIVFVPIGGFFTMDTRAAVKFVNEMKPKTAVPIHYGGRVGSPADAQKFKRLVRKETEVYILIPEE